VFLGIERRWIGKIDSSGVLAYIHRDEGMGYLSR
jgi:hypothetical protein